MTATYTVPGTRNTSISTELTASGWAPESSYPSQRARREGTEFSSSTEPDYLKSWLRFVEGDASRDATVITSPMPMPRLGGSHDVLGFLLEGDEALHVSATAISVYALISALFGHAIQFFVAVHPARPTVRFDDLNIAYFANTTVDLTPANPAFGAPSDPMPLSPAADTNEPNSRVTARELADFMGITLEQLGKMTGIGRTTFSSWQTKTPRPSTLRDLYRMDGLISSLRNTLGDEKTRMWLRTGEPSPFSLLEMRRLADVERMVSPMLFVATPEPKSFAVSPLGEPPLPALGERSVPLRAKRRTIKGGLKSELR